MGSLQNADLCIGLKAGTPVTRGLGTNDLKDDQDGALNWVLWDVRLYLIPPPLLNIDTVSQEPPFNALSGKFNPSSIL